MVSDEQKTCLRVHLLLIVSTVAVFPLFSPFFSAYVHEQPCFHYRLP